MIERFQGFHGVKISQISKFLKILIETVDYSFKTHYNIFYFSIFIYITCRIVFWRLCNLQFLILDS